MLKKMLDSGIVPTRWKKCASVAIEKDPGCPKISRLCIAHLYEADIDLFTTVLWGRKLVRHAERQGAMGNDQFGSCPNKSCLDLVTKKILTYTITRLT